MDSRVIRAHTHSSKNREELLNSQKCGCFYCLEIFPPSEITEWLAEGVGTALCPYCGIDSVIGDNAGYPLTKNFLKEMHLHWF